MKSRLTPLMAQYFTIKEKYAPCIVAFRCGEFLEIIGDEAKTVSEILGTILTKRVMNAEGKELLLTGFKYDLMDTYVKKIVMAGHRLVLVDYSQDKHLNVNRL